MELSFTLCRASPCPLLYRLFRFGTSGGLSGGEGAEFIGF